MLNYLYAEFWRFFHRQAGKILLFMAILLPLLLNLYIFVGTRWILLENVLAQTVAMVAIFLPFSGMFFLFALVDITFGDELRLHTMKNNLCGGFSRDLIYWGKILSGVVLSFLHLAIVLVSFFLSAFLLFPREGWQEILIDFGMLLAEIIPLWLGALGLLFLLYFLFQNGMQAVVAVGLGIFFVFPILQSLNFPASQILTYINLIEWIVLILTSPISGNLIQTCWLVGSGYFVVCTLAGWLHFRHREIH